MTAKHFIVVAILSSALLGRADAQTTNADLSVAVLASDPAVAGEPITLTVVVRNLGPDYVAGVDVENLFLTRVTVIDSEVVHSDGREFPGGCFIGTVGTLRDRVSCSVGSIASQASATITIVFMTGRGQIPVRSWTFAGLNNDPVLSNNTAELLIDVASSEVPAASPLLLALLVVVLGVLAWTRL